MRKIISLFMLLLFASIVLGYPTISPYVNDFLNVLTPAEESRLEQKLNSIEEQTSIEIVIVTVQTTEGEDSILYANHIGQENGVGKDDLDNGVVILWSQEDGGAIAPGRGIESILNDAKVARIGRASRQYFDQGRYYEGFDSIVTGISMELNAPPQSQVKRSEGIAIAKFHWIILILYLLFHLFLRSGGRYASTTYVGMHYGRFSRMGGSLGGGSFGGGSFGGGGGKF